MVRMGLRSDCLYSWYSGGRLVKVLETHIMTEDSCLNPQLKQLASRDFRDLLTFDTTPSVVNVQLYLVILFVVIRPLSLPHFIFSLFFF